jgi:uncharacterized protein YjbJ (UPF0337 family)
MGINKDQVEGRIKEGAGKVQEVGGRIVGSPGQELKGKIKKNVGAAQAKIGDVTQKARDRANDDAEDAAKDDR